MTPKPKKAKPAMSLADFAKAERRAVCAVCKLPSDVLQELRSASEKKYRRDIQIRWMRSRGYMITNEQLNHHYSGKHVND